MKKNVWGILAIALAISAGVLQSYPTAANKNQPGQTAYDWYPVNSSNQISSTTAVYTNMTKASAKAANDCKDQVLPNCLFGTNGSVTVGQNIADEPADQRVRKQN